MQKTEEAPQAPLQPAFYDIAPKAETAQPEEAEVRSEPQDVAADEPAEQAQPQAGGDARRRRRRRGRGGRGGGQRKPRTAVSGTAISNPEPAASAEAMARAEPTAAAEPAIAAPSTPPTPKAPRGTVILAIGLPGSGKSSWFKRHNITPLSSDLLRSLLFDDATEQRFQDLVFSNLRSMLKARLIARRPMNYVDATNLTSHDRHGWIKLARDYGYDVQAVYFDVPLEVCLERNQKRDRVVGEDVMRRMAGKLKPPTFEEGFSKITVVRVKQKE